MSSHVCRSSLTACVTAAALLAVCGQARAQLGPASPIALSGSTQTGVYGPNLLDTLNNPQYFTGFAPSVSVIRSGGYVVFAGDTNVVTGSVNPTQSGIWTWTGSNTNVVKITDNPALGGVGTYTTSGVASQVFAGGTGNFAFRDSTGANGALYTNSGTPGRLLKALDAAPGTGGATFASPGNIMTMNSSGSVATLATLTTGSGSPAVVTSGTAPYPNQSGFWAGTPGALSLKVRMGDQLNTGGNAAIPNTLVGTIDTSAYSFNDSGRLLWTGSAEGSAITTATTTGNSQGLFSTRNGFAEVIARRGDSFPDSTGATYTPAPANALTDGVAYLSINTGTAQDMNNAGHVVYSATLRESQSATTPGGTPTTNGNAALFSDNNGTLRTIARRTFALPAMTNMNTTGLNWGTTSSWSSTAINGADTVAFTGTGITGPGITANVNDSGLFKVSSAGVFSKVLRAGDVAPAWQAVSGNATLGQSVAGGLPIFSGTPSNFAMNALGQMAFVQSLSGVGIVSGLVGNNSGLFGVDSDGIIFLIAQKGMLFHVGPGDDRIVASSGLGSIAMTGNQDGRASNLDDNGNLVFTLSFSDTPGGSVTSSGVFYTHIPAPGSAALLGLGGLIATRRRRR